MKEFRFVMHASVAAFGVYFCMYAFRKPFSVGTFEGMMLAGMSYKSVLIISQALGYMVSKFAGIKLISELRPGKRILALLACIGIAELALLGFALTPAPINALFLFVNGLPLGLVWGIVFSFLEGRRQTEALSAGLSVSFIIASGFVKSVGAWLMLNMGVSEFWMPFTTGLVFVLPLLAFAWLLSAIPPRSDEDQAERTLRVPMDRKARIEFLKEFSWGIVWMISTYMLLTILRDVRDLFAAEIWDSLGYGAEPAIFSVSELIITLVLLASMVALVFIRNNRKAFITIHYVVAFGLALGGISTLLFQLGYLSGFWWMVLLGMGLFLGYVPFNTIMFDRLIALIKRQSNVGFLIYMADAMGYLASMAILLYKEFMHSTISWINFVIYLSLVVSVVGFVMVFASKRYYLLKAKN